MEVPRFLGHVTNIRNAILKNTGAKEVGNNGVSVV
jgi:hypothetical protein